MENVKTHQSRWVGAVLSAALTLCLLLAMVGSVGNTGGTVTGVTQINLTDTLDLYLQNAVSEAMGEESGQKKLYRIASSVQVPPAADQSKFTRTESPGQVKPILSQAEGLLEGQSLYFSPDREIWEGSSIVCYLDDSMLAITWQERIDGIIYTFSEVKIGDASQFRRFLSGGSFNSGKLFLTTEMSESVNAVVAGSGDFYGYRPQGVVVKDGIVYKAHNGLEDICYVDEAGDLLFTRNRKFADLGEAQAFVDENHINFSLAFGPILVENGEVAAPRSYSIGETDKNYARAALCQMDTLHYLMVTVNSLNDGHLLPSIRQLAETLQATACRQAYTLDGGQTATIVMNHQLINPVNYGAQRKISDIIYFATAVPEGG